MLFGVPLMSSANEFREYADEYGDRHIGTEREMITSLF